MASVKALIFIGRLNLAKKSHEDDFMHVIKQFVETQGLGIKVLGNIRRLESTLMENGGYAFINLSAPDEDKVFSMVSLLRKSKQIKDYTIEDKDVSVRCQYINGRAINTKLFVGRMSRDVNKQSISKEFGAFGMVQEVIMLPRRGREYGVYASAFVIMETETGSNNALNALDGAYIANLCYGDGSGRNTILTVSKSLQKGTLVNQAGITTPLVSAFAHNAPTQATDSGVTHTVSFRNRTPAALVAPVVSYSSNPVASATADTSYGVDVSTTDGRTVVPCDGELCECKSSSTAPALVRLGK